MSNVLIVTGIGQRLPLLSVNFCLLMLAGNRSLAEMELLFCKGPSLSALIERAGNVRIRPVFTHR